MLYFRTAVREDIGALRTLFYDTVITVNRKDYTQRQVEAWASRSTPERWSELFDKLYFIVAENESNEIVGFTAVSDMGYLHSMFVHKDYQHQGIAGNLLVEIEKYARNLKIRKLESEVSLTARSFFERRGYVVDKIQKINMGDQQLANFVMYKHLEK